MSGSSRRDAAGRAALLLPVSFLFYTALILTTFSMIFFARDRFQASAASIGRLAAVPHLCYFSGCFVLRPLYRILLPRYSLMLATASAAALVSGMLFAPSLPVLFVLYGLFGFTLSLFWPPLMGWLTLGKEERALNSSLGSFNLSWSGGYIVAPFAAGLLLQRGIGAPFKVAALVMTAVCLWVLADSTLYPRIRRAETPEGGRFRSRTPASDRGTALRYPAWTGLVASYVVLGLTMSILPLFLREELGLSEPRIGLLLLVRALFSTLGFLLLARLSFWRFNAGSMILGQLLLVPVVAVMTALRSFAGFCLCLALFGLLFALSYNNSLFHGVAGSGRRSARMAVHEGLLTAGMVSGSAIGGILYRPGRFSRVALFACLVVCAGVAAQAVLALVFRRRR